MRGRGQGEFSHACCEPEPAECPSAKGIDGLLPWRGCNHRVHSPVPEAPFKEAGTHQAEWIRVVTSEEHHTHPWPVSGTGVWAAF